jgi:4-amino-4-deoxy-L-arabinose transferase-like glycosyltransferase
VRGTSEQLRTILCRLINHRYFIPVCLALGFLVRLLWVGLVHADQVSDYKWYYERALDIASGRGYAVDGIPTAYWPVGYPGFLGGVFAAFGSSVFVAKLVGIVLYLATAILTYSLSKHLFHSEDAARITLGILCLYPNHIAYTALLSTEILFAFLLVLGAVLFVHAKWHFSLFALAGVSWGLATLTKPLAIFVPLLFCLVFCTGVKARVEAGAVTFIVMILTIMPWMIRNYTLFGTPRLSTNGGIVLMIGNNPYATGGQIWDDNVKGLLGNLGTDNVFDGREVEREQRASKIAVKYILDNPARTVMLWPRKLKILYLSDVDGFYYSLGMVKTPWRDMKYVYWGLRAVAELYYLAVIMLCAFSLPSVLRRKVRQDQIGLALIAYFTVMYLVFFANARYHFAVMFWVAIYSGIGAQLIVACRMPLLTSPQGQSRTRDA